MIVQFKAENISINVLAAANAIDTAPAFSYKAKDYEVSMDTNQLLDLAQEFANKLLMIVPAPGFDPGFDPDPEPGNEQERPKVDDEPKDIFEIRRQANAATRNGNQAA